MSGFTRGRMLVAWVAVVTAMCSMVIMATVQPPDHHRVIATCAALLAGTALATPEIKDWPRGTSVPRGIAAVGLYAFSAVAAVTLTVLAFRAWL